MLKFNPITGQLDVVDGAGSLTTPISVANGGFGQDMTMQTVTASGGNITALASGLIKLNSAGTVSIQGISATATSTVTEIENASSISSVVNIINQDSAASAANRIITPTGGTIQIPFGCSARFVYDTSVSRWRMLGNIVSAVTSPLANTNGNLSIPQAGFSTSGYLISTDWQQFNAKISGSGVSGRVPYFNATSSIISNTLFNYSESKQQLGVGVEYADMAAALNVKSDTAQTISDPSSFAATLTRFVLPTSPTIGLSAITPDIQKPSVSSSAIDLGIGNFAAAHVVDYLVTPGYDDGSNPIVWGVASFSLTGITDPTNTFNISNVITPGTENFTTNVWSFSRQINGGGYTDYQRFTSTTFTDTNSGWTAGADPDLGNTADDFLADGSNPQVSAYGTKATPAATTVYAITPETQTFTDANDGTAYKLSVSTSGGDSPYEIAWPGTRNYQTSSNFTGGPNLGNSGAATTSPTTYGYLSDGTVLNISYELANEDTVNSVFSINNITSSTTDPNDGNYYYNVLAGNTGALTGKLVKDSTSSLTTTPAGSFTYYDDGIQTFPGNSTLSPTSYYFPAEIISNQGSVSSNLPSTIYKALDNGSGLLYHSFRDYTDAELASIKVTSTTVTIDAATNLNIDSGTLTHVSSSTIELDSTSIGELRHMNAERIQWDGAGTRIYHGGLEKISWSSSGTKIGSSGTSIGSIYSASATLNFPSVAAGGGTQDLTITVTGAAVGDVVSLGLPAAPDAGIVYTGWVSATNTVTVRATNTQTVGAIDPASATFRAMVTHF